MIIEDKTLKTPTTDPITGPFSAIELVNVFTSEYSVTTAVRIVITDAALEPKNISFYSSVCIKAKIIRPKEGHKIRPRVVQRSP